MKKIILISITLLIFVIGVSCASAAAVNHGTDSLVKTKDSQSLKISKTVASKKLAAKKIAKKAVKKAKKVKKVKKVKKSRKIPKNTILKSNKKVNKVIHGWNPKKHEVSRKYLGNGLIKISYDDGYFRIVNKDGDILSYGY